MTGQAWTGGCQCGAVRFRVSELGRASLYHCRMCQKATGGIGGLLVTAKQLEWTRGEPKRFASSKVAQRGFCADGGTPLTFEYEGCIDIAIPAFDRPNDIPPTVQLAHEWRLEWFDGGLRPCHCALWRRRRWPTRTMRRSSRTSIRTMTPTLGKCAPSARRSRSHERQSS
jgi:hypothetical protein